MRAFIWHEEDSFLHRLNPLTKLATSVPVAILVSMTADPAIPLLICALALLTIRLAGRVPWSALVRPIAFAVVVGFGMFWTSAVFYAGPGREPTDPAIQLGPLHLPQAAVVYGTAIAARLFAILSTSMLFVLTTDPSKFVLALIHQARVSPRVAYSVFAAYRFMPLFEVEFANIRAAHQMRGGMGSGVRGKVNEIVGYAVPLLATAVRKGERVALAMESRAFGASPQRTYFRVTSLGWADAWFAVISLAVLGALLVRVLIERFSS